MLHHQVAEEATSRKLQQEEKGADIHREEEEVVQSLEVEERRANLEAKEVVEARTDEESQVAQEVVGKLS